MNYLCHTKLCINYVFSCSYVYFANFRKESLISDGQKFHQYQQNEHKKDHDI